VGGLAPRRLSGNESGYRRSVAVSSDGGNGVFEESGEPYPFEEREHYAASRKRERFTRDTLRRVSCGVSRQSVC
jgi:hypothetical protein